MHDREKVVNYLEMMYSSLYPLKADEHIISLGKAFSIPAKEAVNIFYDNEHYISLGYYCSDIKVSIGHFTRLPDIEILFINILQMEFVADFICFSKKPDYNHFLFFISKYVRNLENAAGNQKAAVFYNWLHSRYLNESEFDFLKYANYAGVGSIFLLFHEIVHTNRKLIESAIDFFNSHALKSFFYGITSGDIIEVACDFIALSYMSTLNVNQIFKCTKNEMFKIVLFQIFATGLYPLLSGLLVSNISKKTHSTQDDVEGLFRVANKRFNYLASAIQITQNSKVLFSDFDFLSGIAFTSNIIAKFLSYIGKLLKNDLILEAEKFNCMSMNEQAKYRINPHNSVWMYFC